MIDFGFTPLVASITDLDKANVNLAKQLTEQEPSFALCISCGSCSATCTAGQFAKFSFRVMCHQIRKGNAKEAIAEASKCMLCGKCTLACPRNVNTRNIISLVRKAQTTTP